MGARALPRYGSEGVKAITLHQPWASFIAAGIKSFETRDWKPPKFLIGKRIAIHAAKKRVDLSNLEWARRNGVEDDLPLGAVVCTAILAGAYQCGHARWRTTCELCAYIDAVDGSLGLPHSAIPHDEFGDFTPGRWAWWLTDIETFDPIPAKGSQGFWTWADSCIAEKV